MDLPCNADATRPLDLLRMLGLLSPDPDPALDRLSRIASVVTGCEIAMITFIAGDRQIIGSRVGTQATEASMQESFCICTLDGTQLVEISDATQDPRFADNGFVRGPRAIRSYVGVPVLFEGRVLGTFCVLDPRVRRLSDDQRAILVDLAGMVEGLRIRADLPVIISSGNLPDHLHNEARQAGVRALVHKQYTLEELGPVIHWVLAGGQRLGTEPLQMSTR